MWMFVWDAIYINPTVDRHQINMSMKVSIRREFSRCVFCVNTLYDSGLMSGAFEASLNMKQNCVVHGGQVQMMC